MSKPKKTKLERHWEKRALEWRDYARALERALGSARSQIADTACGLAQTGCPSNWDHITKLQYTNAQWLQKNTVPKQPSEDFYP